jgi:hypothetical protein
MPIRKIDKGTGAGSHRLIDDEPEAGEIRRAGAAGIAYGRDAARIAQAIGVLAHIRAIDEDMGVNIDEPRDH